MPNPEGFLAHLRTEGYHPRSDKHSNALAASVVADLLEHCPAIRGAATAGRLVYTTNFTLISGTATWNTDLAMGEPPMGQEPPALGSVIVKGSPSTIQIAVEIKGVMTEHHKAVKNRKRDLEAHHDHVHRYSRRAIAGGMLVINGSRTFRSPLRAKGTVTVHRNPEKLVEHCLDELRAVTTRSDPDGVGLDAKAAIVVDMDNVNLAATKYITAKPAPQVGDPLHYDAFIQTICAQYTERFGR